MVTVLQIIFVLALVVLLILLVFRTRQAAAFILPDHYLDLLNDYVSFYAGLDEDGRKKFEEKFQRFLSTVKITGANADVEDLDRVLIGAAAVIPVYFIPDWEYINLREVLVYPGNFNTDFEQHGRERTISGMVGSGGLENVMILSKWELRQGFINGSSNRNTAVHEFVHLVDKMDGTLDGVPELLLERKYVGRWKTLLEETMQDVRSGRSEIDAYAATSPVECFAVLAEYFFSRPETFRQLHPELDELMRRIFVRR